MTYTEAEARERLHEAIYFAMTANMGTTPDQLIDDYRDAVLRSTRPDSTNTADDDEPFCGVDPPQRADDPNAQWGDCWCTLPPDHDGQHHCQPCTERHDAPGWDDDEEACEDCGHVGSAAAFHTCNDDEETT